VVAIPAIIKVVAVFGLILIINRLKVALSVALLIGSLTLGLWMKLEPVRLLSSAFGSLVDLQTISLILIVGIILLMSRLMKESGHLDRIVTSFSVLSKDPRVAGSVMPALISSSHAGGSALFGAHGGYSSVRERNERRGEDRCKLLVSPHLGILVATLSWSGARGGLAQGEGLAVHAHHGPHDPGFGSLRDILYPETTRPDRRDDRGWFFVQGCAGIPLGDHSHVPNDRSFHLPFMGSSGIYLRVYGHDALPGPSLFACHQGLFQSGPGAQLPIPLSAGAGGDTDSALAVHGIEIHLIPQGIWVLLHVIP